MRAIDDRSAGQPTFVVAGAARSGTSSLYRWLNQHPSIYMCPVKETNYFAQITERFVGPGDDVASAPVRDEQGNVGRYRRYAYISSWDEYRSLFEGSESYPARGEASNSYLYYRGSAGRIRAAIPHCKIIIVLRNPVERAISHYRAMVHWGRETLPVNEALEAGAERVRSGWEWSWDYKGVSLYAEQVEQYLDVFPPEQLRIWLFENVHRDHVAFYREVCSFIGAGNDPFLPDFEPRNAAPRVEEVGLRRMRQRMRPVGRAYDRLPWSIKRVTRPWIAKALGTRPLTISHETRRDLTEYFQDDVRRLQRLLPQLDIERQWLGGGGNPELRASRDAGVPSGIGAHSSDTQDTA